LNGREITILEVLRASGEDKIEPLLEQKGDQKIV